MQNEFVEFLALTSTRRFDHSGGSIAATVSSPSGGKAAFLRTNLSACLKLQNVSGNSGYINSIFICKCFPPRSPHPAVNYYVISMAKRFLATLEMTVFC